MGDASNYVENGLEFLGHATGKHFDTLYDKVVGRPKVLPKDDKPQTSDSKTDGKRSRHNSLSQSHVRSASSEDSYVYTRVGGKHRNILPVSERESIPIPRGNLLTERALHKQEQLLPPKKNLLLDKGLPPVEDLVLVYKSKSQSKLRRDSVAMASGYQDEYRESGYRGENDRPRSQPPRGRYYDDDDSDYDERTGDRHRGGGRGYDDRDRDDYDTVREVREVYRGPTANRPWGPERNESGRSDYSAGGPYGSGAVAQYGRRSAGDVNTYVSRRDKSRGRDSYRSRSRSISRSPSRSRSRSRSGSGIRGKLEDTFSTTGRGLGAGLAGAVIGGLAGREFGHKHKNRDILIGAVVGGLAANAGENKWTEYKEGKKRADGREMIKVDHRYPDDGRSRSNVR